MLRTLYYLKIKTRFCAANVQAVGVATKLAQETQDVVYRNGSATVYLISGPLGKQDNLLKEIKKFRK